MPVSYHLKERKKMWLARKLKEKQTFWHVKDFYAKLWLTAAYINKWGGVDTYKLILRLSFSFRYKFSEVKMICKRRIKWKVIMIFYLRFILRVLFFLIKLDQVYSLNWIVILKFKLKKNILLFFESQYIKLISNAHHLQFY